MNLLSVFVHIINTFTTLETSVICFSLNFEIVTISKIIEMGVRATIGFELGRS